MKEDICGSFGVEPVKPEPKSHIGIALQTLGEMPIHGLRHPVYEDTNGWYIWCGEYSEADDFFQPLHVEHLEKYLPQVQKFLSLPTGFRFVIDDNEYEDVWYDKALLDV